MQKQKNKRNYRKLWNRNKYYILMALPAVISVFIFSYIPMYGVLIAFQDYKIGNSILGNQWVGLKHFTEYFNSLYFGRTLRNTFLLGLYSVLWGFPIPVIFAVFLNEIRNRPAKKVIQTVSYFPHFISVVVLVGMVKNFLDPDTGIVNVLIRALGGSSVSFMNESGWFRTIYVASGIWQGFGWSSIIILSALGSLDPTMYESAEIDGASRMKRILFITLPNLMPTLSVLLIMNLGSVMNASLEKVLLLYHPAIWDVSDVIQTFVYRKGILDGAQSFGTAVGLFNSAVNILLLVIANRTSKKVTGSSLW